MKLKEYLIKKNITNAEFSDKLRKSGNVKTSPSYISKLCTGHRQAGLCIAVEIQKVTRGAVKCADLINKYE